MPGTDGDDSDQINRRLFLQYAATAAAGTAGAVAISLKTDALAQQSQTTPRIVANGDDGMPYPYHDG